MMRIDPMLQLHQHYHQGTVLQNSILQQEQQLDMALEAAFSRLSSSDATGTATSPQATKLSSTSPAPDLVAQEWIDEFTYEQSLQPSSRVEEPFYREQQEQQESKHAPPPEEEEDPSDIAESAAALLRQVEPSVETQEKYRNSKFFALMRRIRDGEVAIEGNKLVEQIEPVDSSFHLDAHSHANRCLQDPAVVYKDAPNPEISWVDGYRDQMEMNFLQ